MEKFLLLQREYLKRFGSDSLDRVLLVEPLLPDYERAAQVLEAAIRKGVPLEQVPEEIWETMRF